MTTNLHSKELVPVLIGILLISIAAFPQETRPREPQPASELFMKLLAPDTPDDQWLSFEKEFEALPPKITLPVLFPEIARGIPLGQSYAAYNCSDPLHDRKAPGWGEFCVTNWLWCKQLSCFQRGTEVLKVLLDLWSHPISSYGHMALLRGLCADPDAESRIMELFRDGAADERLRTEAAACLLYQNGAKYHSEVVAFAEHAPIKFSQPGSIPYNVSLRRRLFDELVSARHRSDSGVDPAVVRMGFTLLLDEAERQRKANQFGGKVSDYGQFIYADHLNSYLGTMFEPDRKQAVYAGNNGNERFWHETVVNAFDWWSKHEREYGH